MCVQGCGKEGTRCGKAVPGAVGLLDVGFSYSPARSAFGGGNRRVAEGFLMSGRKVGFSGIRGALCSPFLSAGCSLLWLGGQNMENI